MKKLAITSVLGVIIAASTSVTFGQGYEAFGGGPHTVLDNSAPVGPPINSGFAASFLWAPGITTAPIEGMPIYSYSAAWAEIENLSGGWQFGVDAGTGSNVIAFPVNNVGGFSYDGGVAFPLSGSTGPGEEISIYAIAWVTEGGLYNTLASAEAADAPVGWSSVFQYTLGSAPPATPPSQTVVPQFMIGPEPTTLALAGLGAMTMIFLRRRKA